MGEVSFSRNGRQFALSGRESLAKELGLGPNSDYEIVRAKKGLWVLIARERPLDKRVLEILKSKNLEQRVEGKLEGFLGKEELKRFKEMLKEGSIVAFKLSPKYKKAVYKTAEEIEGNVKIGKPGKKISREKELSPGGKSGPEPGKGRKESESSNAEEKPLEEYSIEKDGFVVCKNVNMARQLSEKLKDEIKKGEIRGIKGFDGFFYIAENSLYQKHKAKALSLIKAEKGIDSAKIGEKAGVSKLLAKIVCELLKEEGEIIEKRQDRFQAI